MITNIWYMAHAYVGDRRNLAMARRWLQLLREIYAAPIIAPWIELCEALPETEDNRAFCTDISCDIVKKCTGVILVGEKITDGMHMESAKAAQVLVLTTGAFQAQSGDWEKQAAIRLLGASDVSRAAELLVVRG